MDAKQSDKLLFIVANPGAGGHRLGRLLSCLDNVYWYSHENNGLNPWDVSQNDIVKGKNISKYHYDRLINDEMVPLLGQRIEKYWESTDYHILYRMWDYYMEQSGANDIITSGQYISWVLHDNPEYLLERFKNAKVIQLTDPQNIVDRYLNTTALFPIHINSTKLKPNYYTQFEERLNDLMRHNTNPTHRDYWAWVRHRQYYYDETLDIGYRNFVINSLNDTKRYIPGVLNVSWDNLDIEEIKRYLGSESIDQNYNQFL